MRSVATAPRPPQVRVFALESEQLIVSPQFCDPSVDHDRYPIRIMCRVESMGDG